MEMGAVIISIASQKNVTKKHTLKHKLIDSILDRLIQKDYQNYSNFKNLVLGARKEDDFISKLTFLNVRMSQCMNFKLAEFI